MGRTETPVDPLAGPVAEFAYELRKLRQEAGNPTYREMAHRVDVSAPTLSRAASGRQLPSLGVVRAYVRACGQDPAHWEPRWRQTWEQLVEQQPGSPGARPPYLGLARFDAGDADLFFGRDELLARLRDLLGRHRMVAVVGPSGSGKSSLVRAGLVPAATAADVVVFAPGDHPAARLADRVAGDPPAGGRLVIVDQFEEAFTLCTARPETDGFVAALLRLAGPVPGTRVVLTVRADRFGDCAAYPGLAEALSAATLLVGPMTGAELRDAVIKPAAAVGLIVERELTARIVADVQGRPGALPMLSHTLREVWRRRQGRTLPLAAYEQVGGVRGALAGTAETLYTSLTGAQATAARQILLRLVNPDEHGLDTRRPACPEELGAGDDVTVVLGALTEARLVTITDGQVELAHEALITGWPRLREWLDTDRELLRHHRSLTQAATTWSGLDRDPGALYRGSRLALVEQLFAPAERRADLTAGELAFLTAGLAARDAERRAAARARRRLRTLWATLTVLLVIAGAFGYVGVHTTRVRHEEQAVADARRIAGVADATHGADPALAVLLSVAAYRLADVLETRSALMTSFVRPELPVIALPATSSAYSTLLAADGRTAVNLDRGRVTTLRLADGQVTTFSVAQGDRALEGIAPDGRTLALTSRGTTTVWNDARGLVATLPGDLFAFGGSGRTTIRYDETAGAVIVAEVTTGRRLARLPVRAAAVAAISPDDRVVVTCPESEPAQLWAVAAPKGPPRRLRLAEPPACTAQAPVSFSRDARFLALAGADGVGVWDLRSGDRIAEIDGYTEQADLSPDGAYLATRIDQEITVRRVADAVSVLSYPAASQLPDALSWVDHHTIRYLEGNGVRTLDLTPVITGVTVPADAATVSQDGSVTAVATADRGGYLIRFARLGAAETLSQVRLPLTPPAAPSADYAPTPLVALSADGNRAVLGLAAAPGTPWQHRLLLWDVRSGRPGATLELGDGDPIAALVITPGGDRVAATRQLRPFDDSRTPTGLEIWDTARGTRVNRVGVAPLTLTFAPDGREIASDQGLIDVASGAVNDTRGALRLPADFSLTAIAYREDGRQLAFDDIGGRGELWDTRAWRLRASLRAGAADSPWPQAAAGTSVDLAFSHDGRLLAVARDTGITLWDLASGRPLGSAIPIRDTSIRALGFSADDRRLVVAGVDSVRTVPVEPAALARILCDRAGRDLTRDEWHSYLPGHRRRDLC